MLQVEEVPQGKKLARAQLQVVSVCQMEEFGFNEKSLETFSRRMNAANRIWRGRQQDRISQSGDRLETLLPVSMLVCSGGKFGLKGREAGRHVFFVLILPLLFASCYP